MKEEINAYIEYVLSFKEIRRPKMPKFNLDAYNDSRYNQVILDINKDFDSFDDYYLTIKHLKGD